MKQPVQGGLLQPVLIGMPKLSVPVCQGRECFAACSHAMPREGVLMQPSFFRKWRREWHACPGGILAQVAGRSGGRW